MGITNLGDFAAGATVYVPFHTFDSNDPSASVTITGLAVTDIEIYKDGSVTQRASDNGYTLLDTDGIDFDGITGLHGFSIDLSDNSDAGFYAAGSTYWVAVSAITVDAATINFWAAIFTIAKTGGVATILTDTEAVLTDSEAILTDTEASQTSESTIITDTEALLVDTEASQTAETSILSDTEAAIADTATIIVDTEAILVDTGTTLDTNVSAILTDTEAAITARATLLTDTEAILVDTEASQTAEASILSDTEAAIADTATIITDTEAILADSETWDTAQTEPTGIPASNAAPITKLGWLYMMARNKIDVTSSQKIIYGADGTAEFAKQLADDGTTYTEAAAGTAT